MQTQYQNKPSNSIVEYQVNFNFISIKTYIILKRFFKTEENGAPLIKRLKLSLNEDTSESLVILLNKLKEASSQNYNEVIDTILEFNSNHNKRNLDSSNSDHNNEEIIRFHSFMKTQILSYLH